MSLSWRGGVEIDKRCLTIAMNFFSELKRRNVYKGGVAYAVVAWLLIQASSILFPTFDAPAWVMKVVVVVVVIGFPIALIIAWAFELTPEGLKRTESAAEAPRRTSGGRVWIYVVIAGVLLSAGLFFLGRFTAGTISKEDGRRSATSLPAKSIAVLPFASLSEDK